VRISPRSVNLLPGGEQTFSADVFNSNDTSVTWQTDEGGGSITAEGIYTAPDTPGSYVVTAISNADNNRTDSVIVQVSQPNTISVDITPAEVSLEPTETQPFTALVSGSDNTEVIWRVITTQNNQIIERNDLVDADGVFTAPSDEGTYYIEAISQADPSKRAQAIALVARPNQPIEVDISITPATATLEIGDTQRFQATVTGTGDTGVTWNVLESNGGIISESGTYTAPQTAGTYTVSASSVASPTASASATVTVIEPQQDVSVSVSPSNAQLVPEETLQLTAEVTGTANQAVTWQAFVLEDGSETAIDAVSDSGVFTAPNRAGEYIVRATSDADPSKQASAALVVNATLTIDPANVRLSPGGGQQFSATITGLEDNSIDWQASAGSISDSGFYVAPNSEGNYTVTATSRADSSLRAEASVSVGEPIIVTIRPGDIQVRPGDSQQFSVTVENAASNDVNWQVLEASGGTVTETGLYTAPSQPGVFTLQATSVSDATASDSITVYVTNVTSIQVNARPSSLSAGGSSTLTATVRGDEPFSNEVTWSFFVGSGLGTLSSTSGNEVTFTSNGRGGFVIIQATSVAAPRVGDSATIFISEATSISSIQLSLPTTTTTLIKGQSANITGTVTSTNYNGIVNLRAIDLPQELTAAFSPSQVNLASGSATFELTLNLSANATLSGDLSYAVEASASGVTSTTSNINLNILDEAPVTPTLTWQAPQQNAILTTSPVSLEVDLDPGTAEIDYVQFYVDDQIIRRDTEAPFTAEWDTLPAENGQHTFRADVRYSFDGEVFETQTETITATTNLSTAPLVQLAQVPIAGAISNIPPVRLGSDTYLVASGSIHKIDSQNNVTSSDSLGAITALEASNSSLFALTAEGIVYAISPSLSLSSQWTANTQQTLISDFAQAGNEHFVAYGREVHALNAGWTVASGSFISAIAATTVAGQPRLYVASSNTLSAYDANGQLINSVDTTSVTSLAADGASNAVWVLTNGNIITYTPDLTSSNPPISGACAVDITFGNGAIWNSGTFGCLKRLATSSTTLETLLSSSNLTDTVLPPTFTQSTAYVRTNEGILHTFGSSNQQIDLTRILGQPSTVAARDRLYIGSNSTGSLHIFQLLN
jgi:methionine-rich copper-binding protein CopC